MVCGDTHCRILLGYNNLTKVPEELWLFENLDKYVVFFFVVVLLRVLAVWTLPIIVL